MVGFLNSWASGVVVSVIIGSIIEMVLPEGNNKKYVKTVIGIFILFTIISPVIVQLSGGIDLKSMINFDESSSYVEVSSTNIVDDKDIMNVYKKNITEQIKQSLEKCGFYVTSIKVNIFDSEDRYGEINSVNISVDNKNKDIEKVDIDVFENKINEPNLSDIDIERIKSIISAFGVEYEKIYVN